MDPRNPDFSKPFDETKVRLDGVVQRLEAIAKQMEAERDREIEREEAGRECRREMGYDERAGREQEGGYDEDVLIEEEDWVGSREVRETGRRRG
jgi:hypothetical protein